MILVQDAKTKKRGGKAMNEGIPKPKRASKKLRPMEENELEEKDLLKEDRLRATARKRLTKA